MKCCPNPCDVSAAASAASALASAQAIQNVLNQLTCWHPVSNEAELIAANSAGHGGISVIGNITLSAPRSINIPLTILPCGSINTNGFLLTINSSFSAEAIKVFTVVASELTFGAKSCPEIIPQWFGAKGDNATDSTLAIQTALNVAAKNKGTVFLPAGTYRNTGISIPQAVSLVGAGAKVSILRYTPGTGNAVNLQTPGAVNLFNTITNLQIISDTGTADIGINGAIDPLYVSDLDVSNFEITGFAKGIYIPYGLQIKISFGRISGPGQSVVNSVALQLGDSTLGTPRLVNTAEVEGVYASGHETNFVFDGSVTDVHAVTSELCENAFLVATRLCVTGSWIGADTFFFVTRAGGWPIGAYNNYYLGGGVEQDNLVPWVSLAGGAEELSAFQKSEFAGAGRFRMRFATAVARAFQLGDVNPAYLYNSGGSIRAEAVTRPLEINRDAAGAGLSLLRFLQQGVVRGFISVSSLNNLALIGAGGSECLEWDTNRNVAIGGGALAPASVQGHMYVPTVSGTPVGVPSGKAGFAPIVVDSTNNKLYFYSGGAWRDAGP